MFRVIAVEGTPKNLNKAVFSSSSFYSSSCRLPPPSSPAVWVLFGPAVWEFSCSGQERMQVCTKNWCPSEIVLGSWKQCTTLHLSSCRLCTVMIQNDLQIPPQNSDTENTQSPLDLDAHTRDMSATIENGGALIPPNQERQREMDIHRLIVSILSEFSVLGNEE